MKAELPKLSAEELEDLIETGIACMQKARSTSDECEVPPEVLRAVEEAARRRDANPGKGYTADEMRAQIRQWASK